MDETVLCHDWDQEPYLCQMLSFKKNLNYLEVQVTSEKFESLVSGKLLFVMLGFVLLCSWCFVEDTEMHRQAPDLPLFISENLSEMSREGFQS